MKPLIDYLTEANGERSLKNKTYKYSEHASGITYDTTIIINGNSVNIQGHPSAETIDTLTTSDFWIPTKDFASILSRIKADPKHGFDQDVKPASGGDIRFKKIWISYQPTRYDMGRLGLFQSEKGARYGRYDDPNQMWSLDLRYFESIFNDNPNL